MSLPVTDPDLLEKTLERLKAARPAWEACDLTRRLGYLRLCRQGVMAVAEEWVAAGCRAKGIDPASRASGEEWLTGPALVLRCLAMFEESLRQGGKPPTRVRHEEGRWKAAVWPLGLQEKIVWLGYRGEEWLSSPNQGYVEEHARLGMVLGAGNVSSIGPTDILTKMFVENQVVVLKMNPVNDYLGPILERAFAPLIADNFLAIVYGGAEVGARLVQHPSIEAIHLTGSDRTHDAIVWGADPEEQARRKAARNPRVRVPVTSELGCVTPVLIVPGPWTPQDIAYQARHVASMKANNAGFNCVAAQVLLTARRWPLREAFLERLRQVFRRLPTRQAYYPGADERLARFRERYPDAQAFGEGTPWVLATDLTPENAGPLCTEELFCSALGEVSLDAGDPEAFLEQAVDYCNNNVWGTLSCVMLIHPRTVRDHLPAYRRALERLRYGSIGVNVWTGALFGLMATSWGAYPGHPLEEVVSGRGVVHNCRMFDEVEKSVVEAPFRTFPTPPWFADHRNLREVGQCFSQLQAHPSWSNLARLLWAALRG